MLNSKIEKIILFLLIFVMLMILWFTLPISFPMTKTEVKFQLLLISCMLALLIFNFYIKIRNKRVVQKIDNYISKNELDMALAYIETCIKNQKRLIWLRIEQANVLALKGQIFAFQKLYSELKNQKNIFKNHRFQLTARFKTIYNFLTQEKKEVIEIQTNDDSSISQVVTILSHVSYCKPQEIIPIALSLYDNAKAMMYKCISAMILAKEYRKIGDSEKTQFYISKAQEYSPSSEVDFYVVQYLNND